MSNRNQANSNSGISGLFVIGCIFLVLKLCHVITWSWWLVLLPFYFTLALVLAVVVGGALLGTVIATIAHFLDKRTAAKRRKQIQARINKRAGL